MGKIPNLLHTKVGKNPNLLHKSGQKPRKKFHCATWPYIVPILIFLGIKDSGGDVAKLALLVHACKGQDFAVLAGSAGFLLPALQVGAQGGICALANVLPREVAQLQQLYEQGQLSEAVSLQHKLLRVNAAVTRGLGVPGLKKAMDLKGYYGGPVRRPLLPLDSQEESNLRNIFAQDGFAFEN